MVSLLTVTDIIHLLFLYEMSHKGVCVASSKPCHFAYWTFRHW